jgi:hypothetical protein
LLFSAGIILPLILLAFVDDGIYHPAVWLTFLACQVLAVVFGLLGQRHRLGRFTAAGAVVLTTTVFFVQFFYESPAVPMQHQQSPRMALAVPSPEDLEPAARRFLEDIIAGQWNEAAAGMVSYAMTGVRGNIGMRAGYLQIEAEKSEWYPILKKSTPETLQRAMDKATIETTGGLLYDATGQGYQSSCEYNLIVPPPPDEPDLPSISVNLRFVIEDGLWKVEHMRGGVFRKIADPRGIENPPADGGSDVSSNVRSPDDGER